MKRSQALGRHMAPFNELLREDWKNIRENERLYNMYYLNMTGEPD